MFAQWGFEQEENLQKKISINICKQFNFFFIQRKSHIELWWRNHAYYFYTCGLGNIECYRKCKLGTPKSSPFHYTVSTQSLQRSDRDHHHRQFVKRNQSNCSSIKFLKIIDRQGAIKHFSWSQSILTGLQAPSGRDWQWTWPENQKELKKERLDRWWWSARQGRL